MTVRSYHRGYPINTLTVKDKNDVTEHGFIINDDNDDEIINYHFRKNKNDDFNHENGGAVEN